MFFLRGGVFVVYSVPMYIETQCRGNSVYHYLCQSRRTPKGPRRHSVANLSGLSMRQIEAVKVILRGGFVLVDAERLDIHDQRAHGAVAVALEAARASGLTRAIHPRHSKERDRVMAMAVWRLLQPGGKLGVATELGDTGTSTLGALLGVGGSTTDHLYAALDWLLENQAGIERRLAKRHLAEVRSIVFYDVSSSYFEGSQCKLAVRGHSRDKRPDRPQVVYGLLCAADGYPVSIEAFEGNTPDAGTLGKKVEQLGERFGLREVVLVGDRGMVCNVSIEEELRPAGMRWVSALRSASISRLIRHGALQPDRFSGHEVARLTSPDFPGERLVVCHNPAVAARRAANREALLSRTETRLGELAAQYAAGTISRDRLSEKIGEARRWKMLKHIDHRFDDEGHFHWCRNEERIRDEKRLDGFYIIRTNVAEGDLDDRAAVRAYKGLARVERAFRCIKDTLGVRPIHHRLADRVRAHLLLCMLAYHIEHHLRSALAPLLFTDEDPVANDNPAEPAKRSASAKRKDRTKKNGDGLEVRSLRDLLVSLGAVTIGKFYPDPAKKDIFIPAASDPNPVQAKAFELLGFDPLSKAFVSHTSGGE